MSTIISKVNVGPFESGLSFFSTSSLSRYMPESKPYVLSDLSPEHKDEYSKNLAEIGEMKIHNWTFNDVVATHLGDLCVIETPITSGMLGYPHEYLPLEEIIQNFYMADFKLMTNVILCLVSNDNYVKLACSGFVFNFESPFYSKRSVKIIDDSNESVATRAEVIKTVKDYLVLKIDFSNHDNSHKSFLSSLITYASCGFVLTP